MAPMLMSCLTALDLARVRRLAPHHEPVVRTFVLMTIAVPIVSCGLMPRLHKVRGRVLTRARQKWW